MQAEPEQASAAKAVERDDEPSGLEIAHSDLSPDALRGVIEAFVLQEGTDYGEHEYSLDEKVSRVATQLKRGEARLLFDPRTQTISIVLER